MPEHKPSAPAGKPQRLNTSPTQRFNACLPVHWHMRQQARLDDSTIQHLSTFPRIFASSYPQFPTLNYAFPQYRKYSNEASYFKIDSEEHFDELKKMPRGFVHYSFTVKILPDRNYIMDMLSCKNNYWVEIEASEYLEISTIAKKN